MALNMMGANESRVSKNAGQPLFLATSERESTCRKQEHGLVSAVAAAARARARAKQRGLTFCGHAARALGRHDRFDWVFDALSFFGLYYKDAKILL